MLVLTEKRGGAQTSLAEWLGGSSPFCPHFQPPLLYKLVYFDVICKYMSQQVRKHTTIQHLLHHSSLLTSSHLPDCGSSSHVSLRTATALNPPLTSTFLYCPPYPRHTAMWSLLPSGLGSPSLCSRQLHD